MKFMLTDTDQYWWPVTVRVPDPENAGQILEQEFEMQFEQRIRILPSMHRKNMPR